MVVVELFRISKERVEFGAFGCLHWKLSHVGLAIVALINPPEVLGCPGIGIQMPRLVQDDWSVGAEVRVPKSVLSRLG